MLKQFKGVINVDIRDSTPDLELYQQPKAPKGAPNVLYIVWDDTGFAAWSPFGGLIEMPTMQRLCDMGLRYTQFHTTALCSPTRSCLLTGRNHHMNGMACIAEIASGYPGSNAHIPFENAMISEILSERGWNTYAVGKWHLCPIDEWNMASTKRNWPIGRGFERYYGFLGGETNQWYPDLVEDQHYAEQPYYPEEGYHLSKDLVDKAIQFIQDAKQVAPDKPFMLYFCPGATHAPHHAPKKWIEKYKGKFDMGYEKYREIAMVNMKKLGIIPENTDLSPINPMPEGTFSPLDDVRPWDSLNDDEKRLFARMAEVFAAFSSYTDYEIGRLIDFLEQSGELDNTLIIWVSDNGASGEGNPNGSVNENKFFNNWPDDLAENMKHIEDLGSPHTYNHYPTGWAWAFNTPFKMFKRFSYNGGICDPLVIAFPAVIEDRGGIRHQYHHAIDIVPMILECCGIEMPEYVKGYPQTPIQGVNMKYTFDDRDAPTRKETQYYAMLGTRGIWHKGWKAVTVHGPTSGIGNFMEDEWELYNTDEDRSESHNLADKYPARLQELIALWWMEAGKNNVLPLDDRLPIEILLSLVKERSAMAAPRNTYTYYPHTLEVPEAAAPNIRNRSYTILAEVDIDAPNAEGVVLAQGSRFGGHTLFIKNSTLYYVYNFLGITEQKFISNVNVPRGKVILSAEFTKEKEEPLFVANGTLKLYINNDVVAEGKMKSQAGAFGLAGEGLVVGRQSADPVSTEYTPPFKFTGGTIKQVTINVSGEGFIDLETEVEAMFERE